MAVRGLELDDLQDGQRAVRIERFIESLAVIAPANETTLVFAIDRRLRLEITAGKTVTLEPWDLAVLSHCSGRLSSSRRPIRRVDSVVSGNAKL